VHSPLAAEAGIRVASGARDIIHDGRPSASKEGVQTDVLQKANWPVIGGRVQIVRRLAKVGACGGLGHCHRPRLFCPSPPQWMAARLSSSGSRRLHRGRRHRGQTLSELASPESSGSAQSHAVPLALIDADLETFLIRVGLLKYD
jgi:hypothetical protein